MTPNLNREVVGMFYKDSSNRIRLNNLVVLQECGKNDGNVYLVCEQWDVDYSRKYGYLYHMSGCGGDESIEVRGIYHTTATYMAKRLLGESTGALVPLIIIEKEPQWVDSRDKAPFDNKPRTLAVRKRNRTRRISNLPKDIVLREGQDLLDWLDSNGINGDAVWCSTCKDYVPGADYDLCEHCWWCDKIGTYSTPNDRCGCKSREECRE